MSRSVGQNARRLKKLVESADEDADELRFVLACGHELGCSSRCDCPKDADVVELLSSSSLLAPVDDAVDVEA